MKQILKSLAALLMVSAFSVTAFSQEEKVKEKEKEKTDKKETEQIIITRKGDDKEKIVIEIAGDKVTVNGKPADDLKDGDIKVRRSKYKSYEGMHGYAVPRSGGSAFDFNWENEDGMRIFSEADENRAMLGVVTEKADQGARVNEVTKESAASKAGLKEGDIITKVGDIKIEDPDDVSSAVRKHKPGDKVVVTFLRDKKEQKITAELGKWKGASAFTMTPAMPDMRILEQTIPRTPRMPRAPYDFNWSYSSGAPRLGLSVQDTEDGKGVQVIDVDDESNAGKAGIKENDIITHLNDKAVNSADEVAKLVKENKDKVSVQLKIKRDGKVQNIEVKMPRKLKTAEL